MTYRAFVLENWRLLAFGLFVAAGSSFGQTFFISLSSAPIRAQFDLSDGEFGLLYSAATLTSGCLVIWLGRKIDHLDLRIYSTAVCLTLAGACLVMASASSLATLWLAILLLRLSGQGLMSHIALTSMARYFDSGRGKAISIASFGFPIGEAVLPIAMVAMIAALGWRQSWSAIGIVLGIGLGPVVLWLLKGHGGRHAGLLERHASDAASQDPLRAGDKSAARVRMLADWRFYMVLPAELAPAFIVTGLFFHQVHLAASKGWSLAWLASCFVGFAVAQGIAVLPAGWLVDRVGAIRMLPYVLLPLGVALIVLGLFDHALAAIPYLVAVGVTSGMSATVGTAVWAELYGVLRIGAIRAFTAALGVFSSALSPVTIGWLIDSGVSMERVAMLCLAYLVVATAMTLPVVRAVAQENRRRAAG